MYFPTGFSKNKATGKKNPKKKPKFTCFLISYLLIQNKATSSPFFLAHLLTLRNIFVYERVPVVWVVIVYNAY